MVAVVAEILEVAPRRVLAVYAHPDDPYVASGGTIARWARAGAEIQIVVCTNGDKGAVNVDVDVDVDVGVDAVDAEGSSLRSPGALSGALAHQRIEEAVSASEALGVGAPHFLGFPDGELDEAVLRREMVSWVRSVMPDVVLSHDPTAIFFGRDYFNHRDHRVVGWAVLDAVSPAAALPLYFPGSGPPWQVGTVYLSGTTEPDIWVDISATVAAKVDALSCHVSQFADSGDWFRSGVRERAEETGRYVGLSAAESFRMLRLSA